MSSAFWISSKRKCPLEAYKSMASLSTAASDKKHNKAHTKDDKRGFPHLGCSPRCSAAWRSHFAALPAARCCSRCQGRVAVEYFVRVLQARLVATQCLADFGQTRRRACHQHAPRRAAPHGVARNAEIFEKAQLAPGHWPPQQHAELCPVPSAALQSARNVAYVFYPVRLPLQPVWQ